MSPRPKVLEKPNGQRCCPRARRPSIHTRTGLPARTFGDRDHDWRDRDQRHRSSCIQTPIRLLSCCCCGPPAPEIETDEVLAQAVAIGVTMLCRAIVGHQQTGVLDPGVKDAFATQVAAVAMFALDYEGGDADFIHKARHAGHARLRQYFDDVPPDADPNAAINICLDEMLGLVSQIVKSERVYRVAWAN